jgi:hypothetical protein
MRWSGKRRVGKLSSNRDRNFNCRYRPMRLPATKKARYLNEMAGFSILVTGIG